MEKVQCLTLQCNRFPGQNLKVIHDPLNREQRQRSARTLPLRSRTVIRAGLPDFRIASIIRDARILNDAKEDAFALAARDPFLEKPEHLILRETLIGKWQGKLDFARTG